MNEVQLVWIGSIKLLIATFIGFWYSMCGRGVVHGWLGRRKVILPMILCVTWIISMIYLKKFSWVLLSAIIASYGIYFGTMSIGYGAGGLLRKFGKPVQQFLVGGIQGASCGLIAWVTGCWGLYVLAIVVPGIVLGLLGSWFDSDDTGGVTAAEKEVIVGLSLFLSPVFMI